MPVNAPVIQVALPRPLRRTFDYAPPEHGPLPKPGARVRVPFGNTSVVGLVTGTSSSSAHALKPVEQTLDTEALLPEDLVDLAHWLAGYYHHPIGDVVPIDQVVGFAGLGQLWIGDERMPHAIEHAV